MSLVLARLVSLTDAMNSAMIDDIRARTLWFSLSMTSLTTSILTPIATSMQNTDLLWLQTVEEDVFVYLMTRVLETYAVEYSKIGMEELGLAVTVLDATDYVILNYLTALGFAVPDWISDFTPTADLRPKLNVLSVLEKKNTFNTITATAARFYIGCTDISQLNMKNIDATSALGLQNALNEMRNFIRTNVINVVPGVLTQITDSAGAYIVSHTNLFGGFLSGLLVGAANYAYYGRYPLQERFMSWETRNTRKILMASTIAYGMIMSGNFAYIQGLFDNPNGTSVALDGSTSSTTIALTKDTDNAHRMYEAETNPIPAPTTLPTDFVSSVVEALKSKVVVSDEVASMAPTAILVALLLVGILIVGLARHEPQKQNNTETMAE